MLLSNMTVHDCRVGHVMLIHADPAVVRADYARIKVLEKTMFEVTNVAAVKSHIKAAIKRVERRLGNFIKRR